VSAVLKALFWVFSKSLKREHHLQTAFDNRLVCASKCDTLEVSLQVAPKQALKRSRRRTLPSERECLQRPNIKMSVPFKCTESVRTALVSHRSCVGGV
jgi:hypothetical protein